MYLSRHIIISGAAFGLLYLFGFPKNFVLLGFIASILMDIDHLTLCGILGTYNPFKLYQLIMAGEFDKQFSAKEQLKTKWLDFRLLPFHNIFLNAILLVAVFPIGIGMLFHNILDWIYFSKNNLNI